MTELSRRSFIKGVLGVTALAILPLPESAPERPLILWGDGVHDDAPAIQAIFDGRFDEVEIRGGYAMVRHSPSNPDTIFLGQGTYAIGKTIDVPSYTTITSSHLIADEGVNPVLRIKGENNALIGNWIEGGGGRAIEDDTYWRLVGPV